jgi:hypothetical protein
MFMFTDDGDNTTIAGDPSAPLLMLPGAHRTLSAQSMQNSSGSRSPSLFGVPAGRGTSFTAPVSIGGIGRSPSLSLKRQGSMTSAGRETSSENTSAMTTGSGGNKSLPPSAIGQTWTAEGTYSRQFLAPNSHYHGKSKNAQASRAARASGEGGSSLEGSSSDDEDEDELPEFMISRPVVYDAASDGESGTATPQLQSPGSAKRSLQFLSRALQLNGGDPHGIPADADVYATDDCGWWCYVAYHLVGHAPTPQSNFRLLFVHLRAAEPQVPTAFDFNATNCSTATAAPRGRHESGRLTVLNAKDIAAAPCIDAAGDDLVRVDGWSSVAGSAGIALQLRAARNKTVMVHIVPATRQEHSRILAFLKFRLSAPVTVLTPAGVFDVPSRTHNATENNTPTASFATAATAAVGNGSSVSMVMTVGAGAPVLPDRGAAVMAGIDRIMGCDSARRRRFTQAPVSDAPIELSTLPYATSGADSTEALRRHFVAEALKEVELAAAEPLLPCSLCGVPNRSLVSVCTATGVFHKEAMEVRRVDRERGLLSSVFDDLPRSIVEVPRPPALPTRRSEWTVEDKAAVQAYNTSVDAALATCRAAIAKALDVQKRLTSTPPTAAAH